MKRESKSSCAELEAQIDSVTKQRLECKDVAKRLSRRPQPWPQGLFASACLGVCVTARVWCLVRQGCRLVAALLHQNMPGLNSLRQHPLNHSDPA
jgi:hypothetical protein